MGLVGDQIPTSQRSATKAQVLSSAIYFRSSKGQTSKECSPIRHKKWAQEE
ncbi:MAG: hypothetical protein ACI9NC_003418 [Verrucomicrobiales bacterium]|jgi:hypothetical protein